MNKILFIFILSLINFSARAQITLPALFSDHMILQQQAEVPIWGWGKKNSKLTVSTSWNGETYRVNCDANGAWRLKVKTPESGGPYELSVTDGKDSVSVNNILIGEVWLCSGQSNMEMPLKGFPGQPVAGGNESIVRSANHQIRMITIPRDSKIIPNKDFEGHWKEASPESVSDFSATAWYFGSLLQEVLEVPIGLIHVSYGGSDVESWMSKEMLKDFGEIDIPEKTEDIKEPNRTPTVLYNGMLSPVIGYGIKGAIWYQGESNYDRPFQYQHLFQEMVNRWREEWDQGDFPFYFAQIAPFDYSVFTPDTVVEKYNSAYLREAQLKASHEISNSGMAVLTDLGEKNNIHPKQKKTGGYRLAYLALGKTYNLKGFEFQSPEFNALEIKGSTVVVSFLNVPNGITSLGKEVKGFEVAGKDKVFYPATAVVRRKSVVLSSPHVENPIAVRYLFKDYVEAQLWSTGGLPISSFRTDNW